MSTTTQAQAWTRRLERDEIARTGSPLPMARKALAHRIGTTPAALEHVSRGRAKRITAELFARIRGAVIGSLNAEIARAQHELEMARQCGADPRSAQMAALEAGAAAARKLIGGAS